MHTKAASAVGLALCLVFSPIALGAAKEKSTQTRPAASAWRTGTTATVRPIPYQPPATRPAGMRAATTRPAGEYKFATNPKYDYFADHYGFSTGATAAPEVMGYVAPAGKDNQANPFIYRRK